MLKRFLLFAFEVDISGGGWNDFISDHDTLEEVTKAAEELDQGLYFHGQIVDTTTKKVMNFTLI